MIKAVAAEPLIAGDTPTAGLIVIVLVALEPAFGLIVMGKVSPAYVPSVSVMVTGPVSIRLFSAATAAVKVVKSPPLPVLKLPLIEGAPVSTPTTKKPSEVMVVVLGPIVGAATAPPMLS